ncbi:tRNA (cytosine(34)-C(5))-methyltransferase [Neocloeon triangulifer]|uniref:tRNA (cytosine(34)-C(5))-methyltransferase n=1 Tax=Neocloeon triangulifer TaxID=2078957 RepID=UPI00286F4361|nr:tRNA (cytosine(34)-C(5))-methyltransferase [Neocloeon triangulifer]
MGRSRKSKMHKRKARPEKAPNPEKRGSYNEIIKGNAGFEQYYKAQNLCPESEFGSFMEAMLEDLPAAFRITGCRGQETGLLRCIEEKLQEGKIDAFALPWYPRKLAWQLNLTRRDIRRSEANFRLHNFLVGETEAGFVSRQEVVSMIPPLALDVQPHHKVLDMCAAPGSKTAQLIEALHADGLALPSGLVVANDADNKRCYMLVHQAKRLSSPCLLVTNHDASAMPNFQLVKDGKECVMKFDRILCDVPCSGDGTLRKNPDGWVKWHPGNGNNLHGMQYRILKRGAEMLQVGGRLVYSTCTFNPVENEAVVARMLSESDGALTLAEINLPGLKSNPGLNKWTPMAKNLEAFESFDKVPESMHTQLRPHLFPPSEEAAKGLHLERCLRILPHLQNTGGFFVAVLEKHKPLPWESATRVTENPEPAEVKQEEPAKKKRKIFGFKEDPFFYLADDDETWPSIKDYYKIDSNLFPSVLLSRTLEGKKKNIYMTNEAVREIVSQNQEKLKIINTGIKVFARCSNLEMKCEYRLAQEGLPSIQALIQDRIVHVGREDMVKLLENESGTLPPKIEEFSPDLFEKLKEFKSGSCILKFQEGDLEFHLVGWRGKVSARVYIAKSERIHFMRLLGADVSQFEVNKFEAKVNLEEEKETEGNDNMEKVKEETPV